MRGMRELGYVYGEHFVTEPCGRRGSSLERRLGLASRTIQFSVYPVGCIEEQLSVVRTNARRERLDVETHFIAPVAETRRKIAPKHYGVGGPFMVGWLVPYFYQRGDNIWIKRNRWKPLGVWN